ncbi:MAG: helix-turn-helix transcriptional regulator [Treponema sp.]|nr:helix-turn-helix transcriptional regulator [Treponema sp.]
MTELHKNLVYNMKRLREDLAITQMELAERAEISSGYVGEIEMGRKYPTPEVLERLAEALEVRPFRLLMSPGDVADSAGADALYDAAGMIRDNIDQNLDSLMKGLRRKPRG